MRWPFSRRGGSATILLAGFMGTALLFLARLAISTEDRPVTSNVTDTQPARPANRLIHAISPYLLQHAHNPVDWYPWGEEALRRARNENKPIFLSIGYAACHWCHVMERESFENPDVARLLNEHFVSIKVDREERPDLDDLYMNATLLYNRGQGGWPMSVFLTPDQKPFFAGTYFPPESRWGRPGFRDVLHAVADTWNRDPAQVARSADALTDAVRRLAEHATSADPLSDDRITQAVYALAAAFDRQRGGLLSDANKFPPALGMSLMLRQYLQTAHAGRPDKTLLDLVELTLDHMARGGIYDHLAGGFARYTTDPEWLVPHFEKMLYDQALVSAVYLEAFQVTRNPRWADVAADVLDYVLRDLQTDTGGFCSSRDADSEGVEGKYYVWSRAEVLALLGPRDGELFASYYDVTDAGNWENKNILNVQRPLETVARLHNLDPDDLRRTLADARAKLLAARDKRVPPGLDDKILTSWNGLIIASLARAGRLLDQPRYTAAAERAANFILENMTDSGRLLRAFRRGKAHVPGFLDDYAFFVEGLLDLYETTFNPRWLLEAARLTDDMIDRFFDDENGAFFTAAADAEPLIVRAKDARDGSVPAGNSVALYNLLRLAHMLDRDDLRDRADRTIHALAGRLGDAAHGAERLLAAVRFARSQPLQIVIVGQPSQPETRRLLRTIDLTPDFDRVLLLLDPDDPDAAKWQQQIPPLRHKPPLDGRPAAFVCRNRTCSRPVTDPDDLARLLQPPACQRIAN